jgi:hypothetical protein
LRGWSRPSGGRISTPQFLITALPFGNPAAPEPRPMRDR